MVSTTRIIFFVTISQIVTALGVFNNSMHVKKTYPQPFMCAHRGVDNSINDITDRKTSDPPITTALSTQGSRVVTTTVQTLPVSTNLGTARLTTRRDTSVVSTAADTTTDSRDTTTTDFTDNVSSDPSTVGSTASGTTRVSSTETSIQRTTDVSTTGLTIRTTTKLTTDHTTRAACSFPLQRTTDSVFSYRYLDIPDGVDRIEFEAKASKDVHIALSPSQSSNAFYEIVIGAGTNTFSTIRRCHACLDENFLIQSNMVNPFEFRGFWITFGSNKSIAVGRDNEITPFLEWSDPNPLIVQYIGYSTGFGSTGEFRFCNFDTCPFGYLATFNDSCYKISNDTEPMLSRSDARKLCESESAHLVFIESAEEDAFLIDVTSPDKQYWIGANGLPNNFYWDDGSEIIYKSLSDQNIVFDDQTGCYRMQVAGSESRWPDAPCFRKYNYICEYEVGRETKQCPDDMSICSENEAITIEYRWEQTAPELQNSFVKYFDGAPSKPGFALQGIHHLVYHSNDSSDEWCSFRLVTDCLTWKNVPELNTSYALATHMLRWYEAVDACIFYDSHLVTVENGEDNTELQSLISNEVWIGLSRADVKGTWEWYRPNTTHAFFNWAVDQPDTLYSCAVIDHVTAEWKTKSCDLPAHFVCERRQGG